MIDDGQGLHASRPHGAAEPEDRRDFDGADGLAAFSMNKPAVTVMVKRRRGTAEMLGHDGAPLGRTHHGGNGNEERRPRVYQVHPSTSSAGSRQPVAALETNSREGGPAGEPGPNTPASTGPARRRRARRDPTHAPGQVTRIVFEAPPAVPVAPPAEPETRPLEFIVQPEVGYEQVMAELRQLSAKLDLALSARRFRIG